MLYNKSCFGTLQSAMCDQVTAIYSRHCCYIAATYATAEQNTLQALTNNRNQGSGVAKAKAMHEKHQMRPHHRRIGTTLTATSASSC